MFYHTLMWMKTFVARQPVWVRFGALKPPTAVQTGLRMIESTRISCLCPPMAASFAQVRRIVY
jgi:hypothetical protein